MILLYPVSQSCCQPEGGSLLYPFPKIGIPWFQFFVLFRCRDRLDPAKSSPVPLKEEEAIKLRDEDPRNHRFMFLVEM